MDVWKLLEDWKRDNPWYDPMIERIRDIQKMIAAAKNQPQYYTYTSDSSVPMRWNPATGTYEPIED